MKKKSVIYSKLNQIPQGKASDVITPGCIVLEGGAFRGIYTSGVLDYLMENDINFQNVVGTSAGAINGSNYCSGDIGRVAYLNLTQRFNDDFIGLKAMIKNHGVIGFDYLFYKANQDLPMDLEKFIEHQRNLVVCATNCETGKATFFEKNKCGNIYAAIQASASMPYVSEMVEIDEGYYLDGGCSCKIPYIWALNSEIDKVVVIRTRHRDYRKKIKDNHLINEMMYHNYPAFVDALDHMNENYNKQAEELLELEKSGRIFMIAPSQPIEISRLESNIEKLGDLYFLGRKDAENALVDLYRYLNK